ncbi:zinc metalloproteinase nas-15-like [Nematostella vectensis]|uniref:zinc metalloproteinase nas-15-like n=1 Tax=Nematostella vectensis TaxID=45351 RepID=UPI00207723EA|nr:zinc metalloproteinase nas-15-like [Nematostella vectensis]
MNVVGDVYEIALVSYTIVLFLRPYCVAWVPGFYHEQSRPDRDNYVEIVWSNIKEENKHNFEKYNHGVIDSLGVPYDYGSIMHYGKRDFAKWPWQTTIKVKKSGASIGQRSHLSALDAKQMNLFYNCKTEV